MKKLKVLLKNNEKRNTLAILMVLLAFSGCIIYRKYLFGEKLLIFGDMAGDTLDQYFPRYVSIVNHIREGRFSFWNFEEGFGISQLCINLFDPSLILTFIVGVLFGIGAMMRVLPWIQLLRILLSGAACYWLLSQFSFSKQAKLAASYVYGLSGFLIIWGQHYQFGMVTVYLPLLLLFAEKSIQKKKGRAFFPVMVLISCVYGVYLTYMSLIGVGFFLLFRCISLDNMNWKEKLLRFGSSCLQILLGIGMSLVLFLPQAFTIVGISFRTNHDSMSILEWLKLAFTPYERNIGSFYRSTGTRIFSTNLENRYPVAGYDFTGWFNYFEAPVLFFSTLFPFFCVHFLWRFRKKNTEKRKWAAVYIPVFMVLVALLFPIGGMIFNGFLTTPIQRYTFILFPFMALVFAWSWDDLREYGKTNLFLMFLVFCFANVCYRRGAVDSCYICDQKNAIVLGILAEFILLIFAAMTVLKQDRIRKLCMLLFSGVLFVSMVMEGSDSLASRISILKQDTPIEIYDEKVAEYEEKLASTDAGIAIQGVLNAPQEYLRNMEDPDVKDAIMWIRENETEFCRVERDYTVLTRCMDSLMYDYPGVSCYNSIVNGYIQQFWNRICPEVYYLNVANMAFWQVADQNELAGFLGIRYLLSEEEKGEESGYKLVKQFGDVYLYKNAAAASTVHYYKNAVSESSLDTLLKKEEKAEILNRVILLEDAPETESLPIAESQDEEADIFIRAEENDSHLTGNAEIKKDGYALFMIPYEKGWNVQIDGENVETMCGNLGFLACKISAGSHQLDLKYTPPLLKEGLYLSLLFWGLYLLQRIWAMKKVSEK